MVLDFDCVEFVHLHSHGREQEPPGVSSEGQKCMKCDMNCPGFTMHPWRKACCFCKCKVLDHDIPPENITIKGRDRMFVDEDHHLQCDEVHEFAWAPAGLSTDQVYQYFSELPAEKVPKVGSPGARWRANQLIQQIPVQDFSSRHSLKLNIDQKMAMNDLCEKREKTALGVGAVRTGLSAATYCQQCHDVIDAGHMAVFAERAGPDQAWHPKCFVCSTCNELLVDLIYCYKDGKLFCPRHYDEEFKPRCYGCEELIYSGDYSKAQEKDWHTPHFCCSRCDEPLTGVKYVSVEEAPHCIRCYNETCASNCESCKEAIGPGVKDVIVRGRHWHEDCFSCAGCQKSLMNEGFTFKDEKLMCHDCRGINPSKVCGGCGEEFATGEKKVGYRDQTYHERCFVCADCNQPIGSQKFVRREDKKLCDTCFQKGYAKVCAKCHDVIKTSSVKYGDSNYHSTCFTCRDCNNPLAGKPFSKVEGENVCQNCYRLKYAKRCADCEELIEGNVKFLSYDSKHYHRECFKCSKCFTSLAGAKFRVVGGDRMCLECSE